MGKNEKNLWDVIVIGAGASGMMAAITAAKNGKQVLILEKQDKAGKKLLATGNGKCNFTNEKMSIDCFHGDSEFVSGILDAFSVRDALAFFHSIGIFPKEKSGYYYPNSEQASSVVQALSDELYRLGVTMSFGCHITGIQSTHNKVNIHTRECVFTCQKLIVATGLKAAPKLGSDGSLFDIIKQLGHTFRPVLPALCGFYCTGLDFKRISGVRAHGTVIAYIDDKEVARDTGEIQFTDYGLSGIPIFQISKFLSNGLYDKKKVEIGLNLLPEFDKKELIHELEFRQKELNYKNIAKLLNGLLNQKLCEMIQSQTLELDIEELSHKLQHIRVSVTAYRDFEFAQVCSGGIPVTDINFKTLESIYSPNVYFAGEIIDVDGICGGYNLHFAWATGYIAGKAVST